MRKVREEILRLLREDEEFKALVRLYLGLEELFSRIDNLTKAVEELRRVTELQGERLDRHEKRLAELSERLDRLVEVSERHEAQIAALVKAVEELRRVTELQGERLDRLERSVEKLVEVSERHEQRLAELSERLDRLERSVEKLVEVSERHEQRLAELSERLDRLVEVSERHGAQIAAMSGRLDRLVEVSERHERRLSRLERDVRAMRRSLDRISISLEEEANDMVTYFLRQRGVELETRPTRFDARYEFDIYGTDGRITVIGEAKVRAGPKSVDRLRRRVERARQLWPEKFPGETVLVLYCMRAEPGAIEAAEREGVWLLESMKEKVPLKL